MEFYTLRLCGLVRKLPLSYVGRKTRLASFSILGDVELTDALADEITDRLKQVKFDYVVGTGVKVVPLLHGVAKRLGQGRFVVCRKSVRPYMVAPIILKPLPYFPKHVEQMVINGEDAGRLKGKRVVIVDDVVSTGVTMRMVAKLMEKVGAKVVGRMTVIKQGEPMEAMEDLVYLGEMPVFKSRD